MTVAAAGTPAAGSPEAVAAEAAAKATADAAAAAAAAGTKTPEQKAADDKVAADAAAAAAKTETERKAAEAAAAAKAPAKYDLKLPEGGRIEASDLKMLEDLARTHNLTNEEAQAFVAEQDAVLKTQSERYLAETTADKELGGDKLTETQQLARAAVDRILPVGDPHRAAFDGFLNRGGAGNNIHVVRFLARVGKLMAEDKNVGGSGGGASGAKDAASVLYGDK